MAKNKANGNCYLCGEELTMTAFKRHALNAHPCSDKNAENQDCIVLKVECEYEKNYWLYLDIATTSTLKSLDAFLRKIWLECCGHLSEFSTMLREPLSFTKKIGSFSDDEVLRYEYDFGSTTELLITVVGRCVRPKQRVAIRLLGRNQPPEFSCNMCGKEADYICIKCIYDKDNPYCCENCAETHEHVELLPITNSPRSGECNYCGEMDIYEFKKYLFEKS